MFAVICVILLLCFIVGMIEERNSPNCSSESSPSYELSTTQEVEEADIREKDDEDEDDTLLALLMARDMYELEKKRCHAVCSKCRNANWSSDDDGNEYCTCPHLGWVYAWEAEQERYCEHYET